MTIKKKVIVALDSDNLDKINKIINMIKNYIFGIKIGYEFFFNFGIEEYKKIQSKNINIFLDLKLHDIPNTVKKGIEAISLLKPYFTTVHISGGDKMLEVTNIKNLPKVTVLNSGFHRFFRLFQTPPSFPLQGYVPAWSRREQQHGRRSRLRSRHRQLGRREWTGCQGRRWLGDSHWHARVPDTRGGWGRRWQ